LRVGRLSIPGATYFVTTCTAKRAPLLALSAACVAAHSACRTLIVDSDATILAATIMPDHAHLLLQLGVRLTLDRVVAKWKAQVRRLSPDCAWQANYFEHRLRPDEPAERYAWYVFMNPYRARLIGVDDCWPGWWPVSVAAWTFLDAARQGPRPRREWLDQIEEAARALVTGEA
jgi:REP element-mobilizing transposase RayT